MGRREDLDLYRGTPRVEWRVILRRAARTLGVLLGLSVSAYGAGLYVLRCFSTCPSDPAQNTVSQLLTGSIVVFGLVLVVAVASAATRWSRTGSKIVTALGAVLVLSGIVVVALVPSIGTPGDHSGSTAAAIAGIAAGAASAGAAYVLGRRRSS